MIVAAHLLWLSTPRTPPPAPAPQPSVVQTAPAPAPQPVSVPTPTTTTTTAPTTYTGLECVVTLTDPLGNHATFAVAPANPDGSCAPYSAPAGDTVEGPTAEPVTSTS